MRVKRPAASIARAFRDVGTVWIHNSPPGEYQYQIGTDSGARFGRSVTDSAPMCGSTKKRSRSLTDSAMESTVLALTDTRPPHGWGPYPPPSSRPVSGGHP